MTKVGDKVVGRVNIEEYLVEGMEGEVIRVVGEYLKVKFRGVDLPLWVYKWEIS